MLSGSAIPNGLRRECKCRNFYNLATSGASLRHFLELEWMSQYWFSRRITSPETQIDSKTRQFSSLQKRVAFSLDPSLYIMECAWLTLNFRESEAGDGTQRRESSDGS